MNTRILRFKATEFEVHADLNQEVYSSIEGDSKFLQRTTDDTVINLFVENRERFLSFDVIAFLKQAGIDHEKENEIHHYQIENTVVISGWFDIIGKITNNDKTQTCYWDNGDSTTNITFASNETHGIISALKSHPTFRLYFEIVLW